MGVITQHPPPLQPQHILLKRAMPELQALRHFGRPEPEVDLGRFSPVFRELDESLSGEKDSEDSSEMGWGGGGSISLQ